MPIMVINKAQPLLWTPKIEGKITNHRLLHVQVFKSVSLHVQVNCTTQTRNGMRRDLGTFELPSYHK